MYVDGPSDLKIELYVGRRELERKCEIFLVQKTFGRGDEK
jgi:hypothetical protein